MDELPAKVLTLRPESGRRLIVISDIHGNLAYLKGLLSKVGFCADDILIIDGDFLEKGSDSLGTLQCIMELSRGGNVYTLLGNCDSWELFFRFRPEIDERILRYIRWRRSGLLWDMLRACGADPDGIDCLGDYKDELHRSFSSEWDFLAPLPHAVETDRFLFVHAGLSAGKPLNQQKVGELTHRDRFMAEGGSFDKWVVVGHYPVVLYGEDKVCANPIIDRERRIISIDGGCVLKDDGQLNALIIPDRDSEDFSFESYDSFPERTVANSQAGGERSYYIRWGDSRVQVLRRGGEFSRCRHVRTGYEMDILTKYLFSNEEFTDCNDCTDCVLALSPGDKVSVVEETSRGYFVKHRGCSGWYYGELI